MERIGTLIKRLLEQYEGRAGNDSLMLTAQLLVNELQQTNNDAGATGKKVAVILPSVKKVAMGEVAIKQQESKSVISNKIVSPREKEFNESVIDEEAPSKITSKPTAREVKISHYDIEDIPTFVYQQKPAPDLNDAMRQQTESLNERLKTEQTELGSILKETPIKDLRKAIGINDRFVFINELFRGDEIMYERSIKTINTFTALAEAEFWIQRELKTKVGWNEGSETVQHFDQLVRRRFS